uniref:Uncharacterized protein n=1 Tax=Mycena chlorophos TaxID=658473 RepID=A0ABQ0MB35_MYCCL|nr:predicted protein [Mycena chlorophos]
MSSTSLPVGVVATEAAVASPSDPAEILLANSAADASRYAIARQTAKSLTGSRTKANAPKGNRAAQSLSTSKILGWRSSATSKSRPIPTATSRLPNPHTSASTSTRTSTAPPHIFSQ